MTFTETFGFFASAGDTITTELDGYTLTARIEHDDCPDAPDQRQDGFWPSYYKDDPGFIGPGNSFRQRFAEAQARAVAIMEEWCKGAWFYGGIVISATYNGVFVDDHAASLWGLEVNHPDTDDTYLRDVANELLPEALANACAARAATLTRLRRKGGAS